MNVSVGVREGRARRVGGAEAAGDGAAGKGRSVLCQVSSSEDERCSSWASLPPLPPPPPLPSLRVLSWRKSFAYCSLLPGAERRSLKEWWPYRGGGR